MKFYEAMFLVDGAEVQKDPETVSNSLTSLLKKHGCEVLRNEKWNERKLAYTIKKKDRGVYFVFHFNADQQNISALRRDCQLSELIMRTMITDCPVTLEELPPVGTGPKEDVEIHRPEERAAAPVFQPPQEQMGVSAIDGDEAIDAFDIKGVSSRPRKTD